MGKYIVSEGVSIMALPNKRERVFRVFAKRHKLSDLVYIDDSAVFRANLSQSHIVMGPVERGSVLEGPYYGHYVYFVVEPSETRPDNKVSADRPEIQAARKGKRGRKPKYAWKYWDITGFAVIPAETATPVYGKKGRNKIITAFTTSDGTQYEVKGVPDSLKNWGDLMQFIYDAAPDELKQLSDIQGKQQGSGGKVKAIDAERATKKQVRRLKIKGGLQSDDYHKLIHKVLIRMANAARTGRVTVPLMLVGDTGSGKTSLVRNISLLLGIPLVKIEGPHIVEEKIASLPYVVLARGEESERGELEVQYASSAFLGVIESAKKQKLIIPPNKQLSESKLAQDVRRKARPLWNAFMKFQPYIDKIRKAFDVILFIDEFFRTGSPRIQNILRGTLNGMLGLDKIPDRTYYLYASNIASGAVSANEGLDEVPSNVSLDAIRLDTVSKAAFFNYFDQKWFAVFEDDDAEKPPVELNADAIQVFVDGLPDDAKLGGWDPESEVRISPRRIEHLLSFIGTALPAKNRSEALAIMRYVRQSVTNYQTGALFKQGDKNSLGYKLLELTAEAIKTTSDIDVSPDTSPAPHDWYDQARFVLETKAKLGDYYANIPVISGPPGIGKTTNMVRLAQDLGLELLSPSIEAPSLSKDQVMGIPVTGNDGAVHFKRPALWEMIHRRVYDPEVRNPEEIQGVGKYKYLLLIDEFNRVSDVDVFNGLRLLLLERKFNEEWSMRDDPRMDQILLVSAMNPNANNTIELTMHVRDVVDVVPALGQVSKMVKAMLRHPIAEAARKFFGFDITQQIWTLIVKPWFLDMSAGHDLGDPPKPIATDERIWYFDYSGETVYVPPRDIANAFMLTKIIGEILPIFEVELQFSQNTPYPDEFYEAAYETIRSSILDAVPEFLEALRMQAQVDLDPPPHAVKRMAQLVEDNKTALIDSFRKLRSKNIMSIDELLREADWRLDKLSDNDRALIVQPLLQSDATAHATYASKLLLGWQQLTDTYKSPLDWEPRFTRSAKTLYDTLMAEQAIDARIGEIAVQTSTQWSRAQEIMVKDVLKLAKNADNYSATEAWYNVVVQHDVK